MTQALTLNKTQIQADPTAAEQSCSDYLIDRIQSIWSAFCAWITSWMSQLFTSREPLPAFEPKQKLETPLEVIVGEYDSAFGVKVTNYDGRSIDGAVNVDRSIEERAKAIKATIKSISLLHFVANPMHTSETGSNRTALLLKLGADPNGRINRNYTPLHCAVLTGSFLAYKTLREHRANPWIRHADNDHAAKHTPIELAYQMLASKQTVADYFHTFLNTVYWDLKLHLPIEFKSKEKFGLIENVEQMLSYEVDKIANLIHAALGDLLSLSSSKLTGEYYLSGEPGESGEILVQQYMHLSNNHSPLQGTVQQQLDNIQKGLETSHELFLAATYWMSKQENKTELLLQLGANPNACIRFGIHRTFTPLHVAVLDRSFAAYTTLRKWGADPNVRLGANEEGDSCIELAATMQNSNLDYSYFEQFVKAAGVQPEEKPLFPSAYSSNGMRGPYGSSQELTKIIAYEQMRQLSRIRNVSGKIVHFWQITKPLALLIAQYAQYYV